MNCSCRVITMTSFGDVFKLSLPVRVFLSQAMRLNFTTPETHVETIQYELNQWAKKVHAPENCVVISNYEIPTSTLDGLCSRNYNVLLAHPYAVDHAPSATASCVWSFRCPTRVETLYPVSTAENLPHSVSPTEECTPRQKKEVPTPIVVYKRKERQWDSEALSWI